MALDSPGRRSRTPSPSCSPSRSRSRSRSRTRSGTSAETGSPGRRSPDSLADSGDVDADADGVRLLSRLHADAAAAAAAAAGAWARAALPRGRFGSNLLDRWAADPNELRYAWEVSHLNFILLDFVGSLLCDGVACC